MFARSHHPGGFGMAPLGAGGVPRDVVALLAVLFVTFSFQFFASTAIVPALFRLTSAVWERGFLWQLLTYPFVGYGPPSPWILLELLFLFLFARDVRWRLGLRRFWRVLVGAAVAGAVVAVAVAWLATSGELGATFALMQGQRLVMAVVIAAFSLLFRDVTIMLFFVLPIRAAWFLPLELLFAFIAFLATKDLAGFLGLASAVGITWLALTPLSLARSLREGRLRLERWWISRRLARLQKQRGLRVVRGDGHGERARGGDRRDPWVH
jgi:hypothetical protein